MAREEGSLVPAPIPEIYVEQPGEVERRPATILRQTDTVLNFYSNSDIPLSRHLTDYLHDYTLPFISQVRDGAKYYHQLSRDQGWHYLLNLRENRNSASRYPDVKDEAFYDAAEAFDVALVTFRRMPHVYKLTTDKFTTVGSATFQPPYTIEDYLTRTAELFMYVNDVINQEVPRSIRANTTPSRMRARGFFAVGAENRLKNTGTPLERRPTLRVNPKPINGWEDKYERLGDMAGSEEENIGQTNEPEV